MEKAFYQDNPYLDYWKKELDDESLNQSVQKSLLKKGSYKTILDIGTGSGVQIRRNIELGLLRNRGTIIGIDVNEDNLRNSLSSFTKWAGKNKYAIRKVQDPSSIHTFAISKGKNQYTVILHGESVYNLGKKNCKVRGKFPLITGLSLLEHTEIKKSLKAIYNVLNKKGLLYATANYDQHSVFGPTDPKKYFEESKLMQLFNHAGIDYQYKGNVGLGNSHCGSLLPVLVKQAGFKLVDYGSSDWIILAGKVKKYTQNKKKALEFFTNAFYEVLKGASKAAKTKFGVTDKQIESWYKLRMKQLKSGDLYYSCINKDLLCSK